jgi:mannose-6-phosphate isomerase-like protein (cupin superfamily)
MDPYAIKNLKQVENMAAKSGFSDDFEARFARQDLGAERIGISLQRLGPNAEGPFGHTHDQDEEVYVVVGGSGRMKLGDETVDIGTWDAIRVAPKTFRAFAAGPEGLEILAFGTHTDNDASMDSVDWSA